MVKKQKRTNKKMKRLHMAQCVSLKVLKSVTLLAIITVVAGMRSFASPVIIDFDKVYSMNADQIYDKAMQLVESYPYLLELEIVGYSTDQKPIYVIRMTENIFMTDAYDYVEKSHILVDGGVHSRETMNPVMVLKMVEDYVTDYYNDSYLPGYNVKAVIQNSTFHFMPLVNPDGFDVAKFGTSSINSPVLQQTLSNLIPNLRPYRLKANLNGIDINRNFEDTFYNTLTNKWVDQWSASGVYRNTDKPGEDFFKGYKVGSEVETQTLMAYMLKYDFRAYLTYHSMGQVIYYWIDYLGETYYYQNHAFAELAKSITGYRMMPQYSDLEYGYSTHFFANNTLKPAITLETTASAVFPTPLSFYNYEYTTHKLWAVPLAYLDKMKKTGYSDYKVYVDGVYVRDYMDLDYANAVADKIGGEVHVYKGAPSYRVSSTATVTLPGDIALKGSLQSFDGRTYVSFKEIFEASAYEVVWDPIHNTTTATLGDSSVRIDLQRFEVFIGKPDGKMQKTKTFSKPALVDKRLMIPIELALEVLNMESSVVNIVINNENVYKDL